MNNFFQMEYSIIGQNQQINYVCFRGNNIAKFIDDQILAETF